MIGDCYIGKQEVNTPLKPSIQTCDGIQGSDCKQCDDSDVDIQPKSLVDENRAREHICLSGRERSKHSISVSDQWLHSDDGEGSAWR